MLESIHFQNFKALKDTTLPLGRFTMIVGPNGSGKSTALQALQEVRQALREQDSGKILTPAMFDRSFSIFNEKSKFSVIGIGLRWGGAWSGVQTVASWTPIGASIEFHPRTNNHLTEIGKFIRGARVYSFNEAAIRQPVLLHPQMELDESGANLTGVLDALRDENPDAFEALNEELGRLLPEFDRVLFTTPGKGTRTFMLRTRKGRHAIPVSDVSQGTVLALAILTLSYLPEPPSIIGLEEPDRGIHPRLYREVQDALYRLAYPEGYGEDRKPIQVIITTHSPYMLDLHRDHPEEIVIAEKTEEGTQFHRLSDREDLSEILADASLGEVWYSGVLGGVPTAP